MKKLCKKCNRELDLDAFHKGIKSKDGLQPKCKECMSIYHKKRYLEKTEQILDEHKKYRSTEDGLTKIRHSIYRYNKRNPEKKSAWIILNNAVKSGKVIKTSCEICGNEKTEAHHEDYNKPLEVQWLCKKHHIQIHKIKKEKS